MSLIFYDGCSKHVSEVLLQHVYVGGGGAVGGVAHVCNVTSRFVLHLRKWALQCTCIPCIWLVCYGDTQ